MYIEYIKHVTIACFVVGLGAPFTGTLLSLVFLLTPASAFQLFPAKLQLYRHHLVSCTGSNSMHLGSGNSCQSQKLVVLSVERKYSGPDESPSLRDTNDKNGQDDLEWRNLLDGVRQPLNTKKSQPSARPDPLMGYTYEDLNRYAETASAGDRKLAMKNFAHPTLAEENEDLLLDSNAIFLEPDAYLQLSHDSFHLDDPVSIGTNSYHDPMGFHEPMQGYLDAISMIPSYDAISASIVDSTKDSNTIDDVWSMIVALQQRQRNSTGAEVSKDLHRQIFQNEGGFSNQSSVFLESLTNTSKATEANVERRGRKYRSRQQEAIASLNQQIEEMEALLLSQNQKSSNKKERCCQCNSFLSDEELRKGVAGTEWSADAVCRVCYMEDLLKNSKRIEMDRINKRQHQARTALQSYRRAGNMLESSKNVSVAPIYQSVPRKDKSNLRSRSSIGMDLPRSPSKVVSRHSTSGQGIDPSENLAQCNDTAIHFSTSQNATAVDLVSIETTLIAESIYPWVEMVDPDTGEIFYWNEETEEMSLEL